MRKLKVYFSLALVMVMLLMTGTSVPAATSVSNLVPNGDFETAIGGSGWDTKGGLTATLSSDYSNSGASSMKIVKNGGSTPKSYYYEDSMEAGHEYMFSAWVYAPSTIQGRVDAQDVAYVKMTAPVSKAYYYTTAGWHYINWVFTATSPNGTFEFGFDNYIETDTVIYVDDVQIVDLTALKSGSAFDGAMETLSAWETTENVSLETGAVQRGEASMKIAGAGIALQTVPADDVTYKLKGCVKTGENYTAGDAKIKIFDGTNKNKCLVTYDVAGNAAWTGVEIDAISCASGVATVEFSNTGTADVFFDNFKLEKSDNMIPNPSFEGEIPANIYGATKTDTNAHTGSYSYTGTTTTSADVTMNFNKIPCEAETEYTLRFYQYARDTKYTILVYQVSETGAEIACFKNTSGNDWITGNTWKETALNFTTPEGTSFIKVQISYAKRNDTVYVDDLSLTKTNAAETEFRKDGILLYELTPAEQAITSNYTIELAEAGSARYVVAFYEINKTTNVRTLKAVQLKDYDELAAGKTQLSDTITVTVGDTAQNRYELKAYALTSVSGLVPYGSYNNVRSN